LVFAWRGDQVKIKESPASIFSDFENFFVDNPARDRAREILNQRKSLERSFKVQGDEESAKDKKRVADLVKSLEEQLAKLEMNPSVNIELRFDDLDYDIIKELRQDPLIDRYLTPQIGGIRIVLGTIWDFSEGWSDKKN
jgi:hypothetical protein